MKLNHINLVVGNTTTATQLFVKYFGFTCTEIKGDNIVAVLKGTDDFTLVIMKAKDTQPTYPQAFHIGFMQDSEQAVADIHTRLKADGIEVGQEPRNIRDSHGFYFMFEGLMIEVGCYLN